jgi:hypothetical protein
MSGRHRTLSRIPSLRFITARPVPNFLDEPKAKKLGIPLDLMAESDEVVRKARHLAHDIGLAQGDGAHDAYRQ